MRLRHLVTILVVSAVVATIAGRRLVVHAQASTPGTPIAAPAIQAYLVILGIGDKVAQNWDRSITATGGTILNLEGWRFTGRMRSAGLAGRVTRA